MKRFLFLLPLIFFALPGCTLSIIQTDTHGKSEDVVDSAESADAKVDPTLTIPAKAW